MAKDFRLSSLTMLIICFEELQSSAYKFINICLHDITAMTSQCVCMSYYRASF